MLNHDQKQIAVVLWHGFPFWSSIFQKIFKKISRACFPLVSRNSPADQMRVFRGVYSFSLLVGIIPRISTLTLSLASLFVPTFFSPTCIYALNSFNVFIPVTASGRQKMISLAHGLFFLPQYDQIIGRLSTLIWAFIMLRKTWDQNYTAVHRMVSAVVIVFFVFFTGPVGCAIVLIWIRDEIAFFRISPKIQT